MVGWILLSDGLSMYLHTFAHLNKTYGVLGGGVALLIWLYWSGFMILLGAELNSEIIQQRGDGTLPLKAASAEKVRPTAATTGDDAQSVNERRNACTAAQARTRGAVTACRR